MSSGTYQEVLVTSIGDGPTLTAAARASCLHTSAVFTLPNNFFAVGKRVRIAARGRISTAATPGTGRFDLGFSGTANCDTSAFAMKASVTTVPWWLEMVGTCRTVGSGTLSTIFWFGQFQSEAVIGSPAPAAGGAGAIVFSHNAWGIAPVIGAGFNPTAALALDLSWTPSLTTASLICHDYALEALN